jgi:hypothetical protein
MGDVTRYAAGGIIRGPAHLTVGELGLPAHCPDRLEVTALGRAEPRYLCGCGRCPPPPAPSRCCGHTRTHRPEPGVGCTHPGCLCLEPGELPPRPSLIPPIRVDAGLIGYLPR